MANLGVPTKLLHESLGHIISVELKTGQIYRGKLFDGECLRAELEPCSHNLRRHTIICCTCYTTALALLSRLHDELTRRTDLGLVAHSLTVLCTGAHS